MHMHHPKKQNPNLTAWTALHENKTSQYATNKAGKGGWPVQSISMGAHL